MMFVKKKLRASITMAKTAGGAQPTFQQGGGTSNEFSDMQMSARIKHAGGAFDSTMDLAIWGMSQNNMNQLSTLGMQLNLVPNNPITLAAGDDEMGVATVFQGYIVTAYADYGQAPSVPFLIHARASLVQDVMPADATSFQGSADVATIASGLASQMGLSFENNGVQSKLSNPYYSGSARQQFIRLLEDANINGIIENRTVAIWPKNGSRGGAIPVVAPPPKGGMIGYPAYTANGLPIRNLYDTSIGFGKKIKVESSLQPANGEFIVASLDHALDALMPAGKWEFSIYAYSPRAPISVR